MSVLDEDFGDSTEWVGKVTTFLYLEHDLGCSWYKNDVGS